jgi:cytidine deaminase
VTAARRAGNGVVDATGLMREAVAARTASHSPYSRFPVGAALLAASGRVFHGCNVENASFGLTCCAERNAVFAAVAAGERVFTAIAVTARSGAGAPPCGACRQVLAEFSPDLWVYWRDTRGRMLKKRLSALLPDQFVLRPGSKPR